MEDGIFFIISENGRPLIQKNQTNQLFAKYKMILIFRIMEDNLNCLTKWKTASILIEMEDDPNCKVHGR
jgi:hypothetical protein